MFILLCCTNSISYLEHHNLVGANKMKQIHKTFRIALCFVLRDNIYDTYRDKEKGKRCNRSNNRGDKLLVIGVTSDRGTLSMMLQLLHYQHPTLAFYRTKQY